jgi:hypothetical protein
MHRRTSLLLRQIRGGHGPVGVEAHVSCHFTQFHTYAASGNATGKGRNAAWAGSSMMLGGHRRAPDNGEDPLHLLDSGSRATGVTVQPSALSLE